MSYNTLPAAFRCHWSNHKSVEDSLIKIIFPERDLRYYYQTCISMSEKKNSGSKTYYINVKGLRKLKYEQEVILSLIIYVHAMNVCRKRTRASR